MTEEVQAQQRKASLPSEGAREALVATPELPAWGVLIAVPSMPVNTVLSGKAPPLTTFLERNLMWSHYILGDLGG